MKKTYADGVSGAIPDTRVAILQALWHSEHTSRMVEECMKILQQAQCAAIDLHQVPGCYELPLCAKKLAKLQRYDAIVVFGALVKGDTDHYQVILDTCIRELGRTMYEFEIPIVMEVMPVHRLEDLIARSKGEHNKGIEAAQACIDIIRWHRELR